MLSSLIAVACYLIGAAVLGLTAYRADVHLGRGGRLAAAAITLVGLASHAGSLIAAQRHAPGVALSLGDTASIVGLASASYQNASALISSGDSGGSVARDRPPELKESRRDDRRPSVVIAYCRSQICAAMSPDPLADRIDT